MFSSSITDLSAALKVRPVKFEDKGVKSVSKRVTNISEHLKEPITIEQFIDLIMNHIREQTRGSEMYEFTQEDIEKIEKLVREKYSTWEWNFGTSPDYKFKMRKICRWHCRSKFKCRKGIIKDIKFTATFLENTMFQR